MTRNYVWRVTLRLHSFSGYQCLKVFRGVCMVNFAVFGLNGSMIYLLYFIVKCAVYSLMTDVNCHIYSLLLILY